MSTENRKLSSQFFEREADVRRERGKRYAELWQDLARLPTFLGGYMRAGQPHEQQQQEQGSSSSSSSSSSNIEDLLEATIHVRQRDLVGRKRRTVGRTYECRLTEAPVPRVRAVGSSFGWEVKDVLLQRPSPSRARLALITNHTPEPPAPQQAKLALEVWEDAGLALHLPLHECHGAICDEPFGTMAWSHDEKRLAYLAEAKREEKDYPSFWDVSPKDEPKNCSKKEDDAPKEKELGKWHEFVEDWGETLTGKSSPRPYVVDLVAGKVRAIPVPAGISFGQLHWLPDGKRLLAVGWETSERRLGFVYCINRRSSVYLISLDGQDEGKLTKLSSGDEDATSMWVVPTPDGRGAIYASSPNLAPHNSCIALRYIEDLDSPAPRTVVPIVDVPSAECVLPLFPGLYNVSGQENQWLDPKTFVVASLWGSRQVLLAINISTGSITNLSLGKLHGGRETKQCDQVNWSLCDVLMGKAILALVSSPSSLPTPCLGKIVSLDGEIPRIAWSLFPQSVPLQSGEICKRIVSVKHAIHSVPISQGEHGPIEVVSIHEDVKGDELAQKRVLVLPHGGPHGYFVEEFQPMFLFFALQGYVVLLVNYRGSLGFGQKPLETLLGRCGSQDVADVMQGVDYLTKTLKHGDPSKIFVCGGSHGGFLTCHVVGQHPDRFVAAVARNPVVNVAAMLTITDIPDWCLVEALGPDAWEEKKEIVSKDDVARLWEASPIAHVSKVKAPTMIQTSFDDRRVPPSQGREFFYALSRLGVPTRLLTYEGNAHAIIKAESEGDAWVNAALWFDAASG